MPTPPSTPPDSSSIACWGPKRVRRSGLALADRIPTRRSGTASISSAIAAGAHNPLRSVPLPRSPYHVDSTMADPPGTLGIPDGRYDALGDSFPGWARARRCQLTFDGAGGVLVAERAEVHRCEIASLGDGAPFLPPGVALMSQLEVTFQIPSFIASSHLSAPSVFEADYVHQIYRYLAGLADNPVTPPVPLVADLVGLKRQSGPENLVPALRRRTWYRNSMLMRRLLLYCDYAVLRLDRSEKAVNSSNPRADMSTLLNIANSLLPPLPAILEEHPLPPDVSVPEVLLLKYFPTIVDLFPADERASVRIRFNRTLRV